MKFITLAALLGTTVAVASASLPVQPESAFFLAQEDQNQQNIIDHHKPFLPVSVKSVIVVFKESTESHVIEKAEQDILDLGGKIGQRYNSALKGFSALIPYPIVEALSTNPFIDYIEDDNEVNAYI
ncbi:hypothetical protein BGZ65_000585 [Modicella reniformis]|uniref:Inhibitor I9 domain-containing protein n=1 Tax=Modicella reniformis TaxID=1440133 RepID=A0A9P6SNU0_9FUNG|nr:hypothetical protein BGZ65_000585 [Modicella reniformis]